MKLSINEKKIIDAAILRLEARRESFSCCAIRHAAIALDILNHDELRTKYADFFGMLGNEYNLWFYPDGTYLGGFGATNNRNVRIMMLTMFKELYGKVL